MKATGVTKTDLERAAHAAGVRLYDLRRAGKWWRFTLKTDTARYGFGKAPWRRKSRGGYKTIPGRVCWHGHRKFFRELFARRANARIETAMVIYCGWKDFEKRHRNTISRRHAGVPREDRNAGFAPSEFDPDRELCTCQEVEP